MLKWLRLKRLASMGASMGADPMDVFVKDYSQRWRFEHSGLEIYKDFAKAMPTDPTKPAYAGVEGFVGAGSAPLICK